DKLNNTKDEFTRNSLMLVVDSVDPEKVKMLLESELDYLDERHAQAREFYDKGAAFGPAMGMLGTLIGLINLLKQMDDPSALGPAMAVALITTFYGSLLANLVFSPISAKLKARHDEEYLCKMIISEGVQSIQAGENPRFIEEKLTQFLSHASAKGGKGKKGDDGASKEKKGKK
ncbi:MAG: MotA/TolQ/ExbB proton channel family protein, partial [Oscillospiraceae bacterium]